MNVVYGLDETFFDTRNVVFAIAETGPRRLTVRGVPWFCFERAIGEGQVGRGRGLLPVDMNIRI